MRFLLRAFCFFFVLSGAAYAAPPEACSFNDAVYENVENSDIAFWSEPYSRSVIPDEWTRFPVANGTVLRKFFTELPEQSEGGERVKRSYFLIDPMGGRPQIFRTYDEFTTNLVPYFFFDEKIGWVDPKNVKTAPAYFFMPGMADIPTAFFRLRKCNVESTPMQRLRPDEVLPSQNCEIERAVFENMRDPSVLLWFEPTKKRSHTGLAMVVEGGKARKRAWLMEILNGIGEPSLYGTTEDDTDSAGFLYSYDAMGRPSSKDPATRFVFADGLPDDVPYAMFRLKECKPETPAAKPTP